MKTLTRIDDQWKQRISPTITAEEITLLRAALTPDNREAKRALSDSISARSLTDASAEDSAAAQALYVANLPAGAVIIAADLTLPDGHGIINCRVAGEHKQIRF